MFMNLLSVYQQLSYCPIITTINIITTTTIIITTTTTATIFTITTSISTTTIIITTTTGVPASDSIIGVMDSSSAMLNSGVAALITELVNKYPRRDDFHELLFFLLYETYIMGNQVGDGHDDDDV